MTPLRSSLDRQLESPTQFLFMNYTDTEIIPAGPSKNAASSAIRTVFFRFMATRIASSASAA